MLGMSVAGRFSHLRDYKVRGRVSHELLSKAGEAEHAARTRPNCMPPRTTRDSRRPRHLSLESQIEPWLASNRDDDLSSACKVSALTQQERRRVRTERQAKARFG